MDPLSIESVSAFQTAMIRQEISVAVLAKVNQATNAQAEAVLSLLDSAVETIEQQDQASQGEARALDIHA